MELVLTQEQIELRETLRAFLKSTASSDRIRKSIDSSDGFDRDLWSRLTGEMGISSIGISEELGGFGGGHIDRSVVATELGRFVVPSPYLSSAVLAVDVLRSLGGSTSLLEELVAGERIAAVASDEEGAGGKIAPGLATEAVEADGGWRITGTKTHVVWGTAADVLLVYSSGRDGESWYAIDAAAHGVHVSPLRSLDPTRRLARITFANTPAQKLEGDAATAQADAWSTARIALAAEQLGGWERSLEEAVAYAKLRVQFGREIGSYQAVKHSIADIYIGFEQAASVVRFAAWTADEDRASLPAASGLASVFVGRNYADATMAALRVFGGMGYTWEHDAHLYYKHARGSALLLQGSEGPRIELARAVGI